MGKGFRKGFTLIEIIIVIVILGVLATLALPKVTGQVEAARGGEAMAMLGVIKRAADACYDASKSLESCDTFDELGVERPGNGALFSYFGAAISDTKAEYAAKRNSKNVTAGNEGKFICLEFDTTNDSPVGFGTPTGGNPYGGVVSRSGAASRSITTCTIGWIPEERNMTRTSD